MRADLERVALRPFNILIVGETGTGKTQMARQIRRMSAPASKPFVELNCANLPEYLVEAELFGHRKGAFTGACLCPKGATPQSPGLPLRLPWEESNPRPTATRLRPSVVLPH